MRTTGNFAAITAAVLLLATPACAQVPESEPGPTMHGRWLTQSGNLEVELAPCGAALCGTVVKVIANRSMADPGKTVADPAPILGVKIMHDFAGTGPGGELQGRIFNRENGKTYDCLISLQSVDELRVRAYVGIPLFGQTQIWRRVGEAR